MPTARTICLSFAFFLLNLSVHGRILACDLCGSAFNPRGSTQDHTHAAGPIITTPTANTLGRGHVSVGWLFDHQRDNAIPAEDAHARHEAGRDIHGKTHDELYHIAVGVGVLENLDLSLTVPITSHSSVQVEDEDHLGRHERATGFGDLRLAGKYRFWQEGADAALLLGVKAPTGLTSHMDRSGRKTEAELEPGSGSWDFLSGLTVSRSFRRHVTLAGAFRYTYRGEGAQDRKLGDVFRYDLATSYALRPFGEHPNLSLVLELLNQWELRDHSREENKVFDSGGTTILISPGVSAELTDSLSAFWAMPIPIYQNLGGQHEELTYEIITGLSWHF